MARAMTHLHLSLSLSLVGSIVVGCTTPIDDGRGGANEQQAGTGGIAEGSPEALGVLRVANETTESVLYRDVDLTAAASRNIVAGRPYATLRQLDDVPQVGAGSFRRMLAYAVAKGWVATVSADAGVPDAPAAPKRIRVLFDVGHGQTAGNADWIVSTAGRFPVPPN